MLRIRNFVQNLRADKSKNVEANGNLPSGDIVGEVDEAKRQMESVDCRNGVDNSLEQNEQHEVEQMKQDAEDEVNEILFLIGGGKGQFAESSDERVEVFNTKSGKYHKLMALPMACTASAAAAIPDSSALLVAGGYAMWKAQSKAQLYDFAAMQWQVIQPLKERRWGAVAVSTSQGVIVIGGCDNGTVHSSAELYNHRKLAPIKWEILPSMLTPRCNFGATVVGDQVVVVGGGSGFYYNSALSEVELYNTGKKTWTSLPRLQQKRYGCSAVSWGDKVIVCGGCDQEGEAILQVEVMNLTVTPRKWDLIDPLPAPCLLCRATILNNKLVVFDGEGGEESETFVYDFETRQWSEWEQFNMSRGFSVVAMKILQSLLH